MELGRRIRNIGMGLGRCRGGKPPAELKRLMYLIELFYVSTYFGVETPGIHSVPRPCPMSVSAVLVTDTHALLGLACQCS